MTLNELLTLVSSKNNLSVCIDSHQVKPGDVFVAVKGTTFDGRNFIEKAIKAGAEFIVTEQPCKYKDVEVIIVEDSSCAVGILAQAAKGNPAENLTNLAVTGTNGKTTVAFLVHSIINSTKEKCGLIGTVLYDTGSGITQAQLTTPDSLAIAEMTEKMVKAGTKYMAIEASSHALSQNRLAAIKFKAAAFTNLTGDHLDYHKTEKQYLAAKSRLFEQLSADSTAVLNKESEHAKLIAEKTKAELLWYAVDTPADLTAHIESMDITGTQLTLEYAEQKQKVKTALLGRFNVSNILAAAGLCLASGFDLETIAKGITAFKTVPGRLEKIDSDGDFAVLIDYAHTDDALKNVLSTLKPLCKLRRTMIFGL